MKRILSFFLTLVLTAALLCPAALAVNETAAKDRDWVYITLDPGHGGDGAGGIHEIGRRGLGQVHDLVTIGEERLLDGLLQGHALDIGSDYDSHWPSF